MPSTDQEPDTSIMGSIMEDVKPRTTPVAKEQEWTDDNPKSGSVAYLDLHPEEAREKESVRIMVDIRMSNGMQIRQRNLSHRALLKLVENLEALC